MMIFILDYYRSIKNYLFGPTNMWSIVFLCCWANFINAADRVIMPIAIIPISDAFGWDLHQHGWVLSAFSVGYFSSMVSYMFNLIFLDNWWKCSSSFWWQFSSSFCCIFMVFIIIDNSIFCFFYKFFGFFAIYSWCW